MNKTTRKEVSSKVMPKSFGVPRGWEPLERIEDAWRVVEAMRDRGYMALISSDGAGMWNVMFISRSSGAGQSYSISVEEAICEAAISAIDRR